MVRKQFDSIDAFLAARRITQSRLACELGISPIFLSEIRRRKRTPRLELALRISQHCSVPVESLVGRRGAAA